MMMKTIIDGSPCFGNCLLSYCLFVFSHHRLSDGPKQTRPFDSFTSLGALGASAAVKKLPTLDTIDHPVNFNEVIISPSFWQTNNQRVIVALACGEETIVEISWSKIIIYSKPVKGEEHQTMRMSLGYENWKKSPAEERWWKWMIIVCIIW